MNEYKYTYGVAALFFDGAAWQLAFADNTGYRDFKNDSFSNDDAGYKGMLALIKAKFADLRLSSSRVLLVHSPPGSAQFFPRLYQEFPPVIVVHPERLLLHEKRLNKTFANQAQLLAEAAVTGLSTEQLMLETTNICTFNCLFCPQDKISRKKERLPFEAAVSIVDEYAASGIGSIAFHLMGEPTTNPYLPDLVKKVADYKIDHTLTTNASTLTEDMAATLFQNGLRRIQLSVQTFGAEQYYKYKRPAPHYKYEKTLDNIKHFFQAKWRYAPDAEVEIHVMDNSLYQPRGVKVVSNDAEAKDVVEFWKNFLCAAAEEAGLSEVSTLLNQESDVRLARDSWANVNYFFEPSISLKFKMAGHWTQEFLRDDEIVILAKKGVCKQVANGGSNQLAVLSNGDAVLCCFDYDGGTKIGNIYQSSLRALDEKANVYREKLANFGGIPFKTCRRCLGIRVKVFNSAKINDTQLSVGTIAVSGTSEASVNASEQFRNIGIENLFLVDELSRFVDRDDSRGQGGTAAVFPFNKVPEEIEAIIFPSEWHYDADLVKSYIEKYPEKYICQVDLVALSPFNRERITTEQAVGSAADKSDELEKEVAGTKHSRFASMMKGFFAKIS